MAEIYLCAAVGPEGFEKEVAIKVVRSFLARDDGFMKMFVDEARLASRLNHANVVQIFDFAKHEDSYFIAMEYVRGVSLWDLRRRCRELGIGFPVTLAAEIGVHVARGLHYAHSLTERGKPIGLVHRDVTPHNVLISFDGAIKLTDFGIAKASGNQASTAAGMLKGKFAYMSPEQARGEKIDARTDVFALGIVLWEMLTGGRLFEGDSDVAVLRAVQMSYISPPQRLNPDVPPELDNAVMRALERDESKRFQSAQELERALANFVLRHAKSVEDTNVGIFVSQMFRDELEEMREAEYAERTGTHSTAKEPVDSIGHGPTAVVQRDHSKPRESAPRSPPSEKPRTALMPGIRPRHDPPVPGIAPRDEAPVPGTKGLVPGIKTTVPGNRPRGPLEDEDDASQQRTDQMRGLTEEEAKPATPGQPGVVLKPSFAKEVAEASRQLREEEEGRHQTDPSAPRTSGPKEQLPASDTVPAARPRKSVVPYALVSLVAAGFIGGLGYMWMFKERDQAPVPIVTAPPPPLPAPAPLAEPKPEPPKVATPTPTPAPTDAAPTPDAKPPEAKPPEQPKPPEPPKPAPVVNGYLVVDAVPFATLIVDNRAHEVVGTKKLALKPGSYVVKLEHPKRLKSQLVNISANKTVTLKFRPLETE